MQHQTARQVVDDVYEDLKAEDYPRRFIAQNSEVGRIYVTENDRTQNTHILGTTEQGKSKLLEMLMSMDVWNLQNTTNYNSGFCFIDSTEHGKTMYKVLKYCIKKGYNKVLVIDPQHFLRHEDPEMRYVVPINPLDYNAPSEAMTSHIADSLRVLWKTEDFRDESVITRNMRFVVEALHRGRYTMAECEAMIVPSLAGQRAKIINNDKLSWVTRKELERIYHTCKDHAWNDVQPTLRRFDPFSHSSMKEIFGSTEGVNFQKLIKDGWVILCNLHKSGVFDTPQQRLLGTVILNEIVRARERMTGYDVPYHVYIDEFAYYVTDKITDILMMGRHLKLFLTVAHQGFFQIDMPKVKSAVKVGCKCKFLFYTPDDKDLYEMIGMMYGGELKDRDVKAVLDKLKKQQAAMKIGKQPTRIADLRDWPDVEVTDKEVKEFLINQFKSNPQFYRRKDEVWGEIKNRFAVPTPQARAPRAARPAQSPTDQTGTTGEPIAEPSPPKDTPKPRRKSVFDNIAGG